MAQQPELPDRLQRDLEEALREGGVDKLPAHPSRKREPVRVRLPDPRPRHPGQLVLIGVGLAVLGLLFPVLPYRALLIVFGVACVALAIATHLMQPEGHVRHYWRGRYLDIPSSRWQERLYRLIYRHRHE